MKDCASLDLESLSAERILVIAPHPDDEALGCGGLIARLASLGRRFRVVFVTDGSASHRQSATWPRARLAARREDEARAAVAILGPGVEACRFLRLADAAMPAPGTPAGLEALETLAGLVGQFSPDLALLPWRRDPHCDHRDSWTLAHAAFAAAHHRPAVLEYAVWLDEIGAPEDRPAADEAECLRFDIAGVLETKRAAVAAHVSQTTDLIGDDPTGFRLTPATIARLTGRIETYWRPLEERPA